MTVNRYGLGVAVCRSDPDPSHNQCLFGPTSNPEIQSSDYSVARLQQAEFFRPRPLVSWLVLLLELSVR